ncbi:hypothetical protein GQ602_005925 [Ophiocordyceps camponoti-floridani]|uniref:Uncharacterized protein n=1 Tax=Ophiocordyceps camponoti-floridani TaxID=2030778 RepID=A0A8H4Q281_9HYPO|nr:hypothetical protein GQ602_005925 [Ophiocordyceps camponoti-floridani]
MKANTVTYLFASVLAGTALAAPSGSKDAKATQTKSAPAAASTASGTALFSLDKRAESVRVIPRPKKEKKGGPGEKIIVKEGKPSTPKEESTPLKEKEKEKKTTEKNTTENVKTAGNIEPKTPGQVQQKTPGKVEQKTAGNIEPKTPGQIQQKTPGKTEQKDKQNGPQKTSSKNKRAVDDKNCKDKTKTITKGSSGSDKTREPSKTGGDEKVTTEPAKKKDKRAFIGRRSPHQGHRGGATRGGIAAAALKTKIVNSANNIPTGPVKKKTGTGSIQALAQGLRGNPNGNPNRDQKRQGSR